MWIRINTDTDENAQNLVKYLLSVEYVKSVEIEDTSNPIENEDWALPGRPATDDELEQLAEGMINEEGQISTEELRSKMKEWKKRRSA